MMKLLTLLSYSQVSQYASNFDFLCNDVQQIFFMFWIKIKSQSYFQVWKVIASKIKFA